MLPLQAFMSTRGRGYARSSGGSRRSSPTSSYYGGDSHYSREVSPRQPRAPSSPRTPPGYAISSSVPSLLGRPRL
ncbi:unnamed protein product [Linum trigynum]|uniref:Uncharacterized protein n=1 Tax=Linum trigynum TaxID=586398 RepID=A0AAV2CXY7_9ROSI